MVVVSEIMRYFKISKNNINDNNYWNKIVKNLRNSLMQQSNLDNKILVVKIQDIITDDSTMIPKLEFHKERS